jgi:hypothetical protein
MRRTIVTVGSLVGCLAAWLLPSVAGAQDRAVVQVGQGPYAPAPPAPPTTPFAVVPDRRVQAIEPPADADRSVVRLHLGPMAATTGRGLGPGLGVAADFGSGTLGFRLAAAWLHGESSAAGPLPTPSPIGGSLAQYTGELTLDFAKRGPLHPVLGIGFGYAHVDSGQAAGGMGIGTARAALEYALLFDDADVRFSAGILGALPGPADSSVADVRGWALFGAMVGVGL